MKVMIFMMSGGSGSGGGGGGGEGTMGSDGIRSSDVGDRSGGVEMAMGGIVVVYSVVMVVRKWEGMVIEKVMVVVMCDLMFSVVVVAV